MSQPVNWNIVASYAKGVWVSAGPLLGVLIGAYVANRNQRKHWIADNKKQEYRELITALSRAYLSADREAEPSVGHGPEQQHSFAELQEQLYITINDRIFIAREIRQMRVMDRWIEARGKFQKLHVPRDFAESVDEISVDLTNAAIKLLG